MNIRRILISEQEKQSILGLYGVDKDLVNEQEFKIDTDGTYTVKYNQEFSVTGQQFGGSPSRVQIKKGTKIKPKDGKLIFNVYYGTVSGVYDKISSGTYTCGNTSIIVGTTQQYGQVPPPGGFISTIRSLFCNGNKLKTDNKTTELIKTPDQQKKVVQKPKKIKLPNLTEKNFCNLPGDTVWDYAKIDDGTWYTRRKGQEDWIKLETPKFQGAINLLEKDSKCGSLEKIPQTEIIPIDKLPTKPIEQIATKTPEIQLSPNQQLQQNLNTATKGLNYLQGQNNKGI